MLENPEPMARGHPHDKSGRENVERNREEHPEALVIARPCCQRRAPSEKNRGGGTARSDLPLELFPSVSQSAVMCDLSSGRVNWRCGRWKLVRVSESIFLYLRMCGCNI